jgi:hypothetical protein
VAGAFSSEHGVLTYQYGAIGFTDSVITLLLAE